MKCLIILALGLASVAAAPERIVGGSITSISQYPFGVVLLYSPTGSNFGQQCGGSIINNRSILTAAHCFNPVQPSQWRGRVGSTNAHSGGVVHLIQSIISHPQFNRFTNDNDISILRVVSVFSFNINVSAGSIAGPNYNVPDNAVVWAIGWGTIYFGGPQSEQLRHVQIWTVNQAICRTRYAEVNINITYNMICSGWLDVGGRDQCTADSGGPLLHNNVIVGVSSFGHSCAHPRYPGVNTRVSRYTNWIVNNV